MPASRSTVSFSEETWAILSKEKNKSKIVNHALMFYFKAKKLMKQKEEELILSELSNFEKTGEFYSFDETFKP